MTLKELAPLYRAVEEQLGRRKRELLDQLEQEDLEPREQELLQLRLRSINPAIRDAHALAWICEHYCDRTGVRLAQRYLFRFTPPEKGQIRSIQRRSRNWSEERLDETEGKTGGQK